MRIFEHPNTSGDWKCPICKTNEDKQVILVGVDGTEEGNNMQAEQIHVDCIDLRLSNERYGSILYQIVP
jgi:hypothetical protein